MPDDAAAIVLTKETKPSGGRFILSHWHSKRLLLRAVILILLQLKMLYLVN